MTQMLALEMQVLFPEIQSPQVLDFVEQMIQQCVKKSTTVPRVLGITPKWDL